MVAGFDGQADHIALRLAHRLYGEAAQRGQALEANGGGADRCGFGAEFGLEAGEFGVFGMGLRLFDVEKSLWVAYWVNAKSGAMGRDGTPGSFEGGAGIFDSTAEEDGKTVIWRGLWDRIVPGKSHNWSQLVSRDGGKSWEATRLMEWIRV